MCLRSSKSQNILLLIASYSFYSAWDWRFLSLLLMSTCIDYYAAIKIEKSSNKKSRTLWLMLSVIFNLSMLGFFKYYNFGIEALSDLLAYIGLNAHISTLNIILPVGISFYTFQTISYTVDVYRKKREPTKNLLNFSVYVAFFPQLVAGPIEKSTALLPQVENYRRVNSEDVKIGLLWILLGYFKKVVIADTMAPMVEHAFNHVDEVSGLVSMIVVVSFAIQIYGDFSGYTLIARGISRLMGIRLTKNFNAPYLASSPRDFWKRWHISLSSWLQEYLYISLGGNKKGTTCKYISLMLTMLLGGLWHGARWNFLLWGFYHGLLLIICHSLSKGKPASDINWNVVRIAKTLGTFSLVLFGWLLFRVENMSQLWDILINISNNLVWGVDVMQYLTPTLTCFTLIMSYHIWIETAKDELVLLKLHPVVRFGVYVFLIVSITAIGFKPTAFLYFQF